MLPSQAKIFDQPKRIITEYEQAKLGRMKRVCDCDQQKTPNDSSISIRCDAISNGNVKGFGLYKRDLSVCQ